MNRLLLLVTFAFFAICGASLQAQNDEIITKKDDVIIKKLTELQKTLDGIDKELRKEVAQNKEDIKEIKKQLEDVKKELDTIKNGKLKTLKIDEKKEDVKQKSTQVVRKNPVEVQYGRVRIINSYHLDQKVVVNGEEYYVKAGEAQSVNYVASGEFTYKIIGIHSSDQKRTIAPNEVFTVTVYPKIHCER